MVRFLRWTDSSGGSQKMSGRISAIFDRTPEIAPEADMAKKRVNLPRVTRSRGWTLTSPTRKNFTATLVASYSASGVRLFVFRVMRPRSR